MSFGAIQHMVTSVKNNSNLLNKRKRFEKGMGLSSSKAKKETSFPSATPHQIRKLREQLQAENKRKQLQTNVATVVFGVILVMFLYLLIN
jgi:hypothetical protein